ncbi:hypothetical protein F441_21627 [Phytophthora nicotianae CJ01A1]|uniref:Uncharacterized protein n=5 Tax=Phytophthora nicotianae TaxID=4792 RepID=W2QVM5_PHYN3|nr:hypothetical protein PPTG_21894 [Phytophthora nicotianae INRA-310]ETI31256.1 hypothetical protein F443_21739 [Phytophthora nicotianae P1569]ETL25091.1 hypothetical protein L916_21014 [Phytophthora nicotianae]ETO59988.1 hypothetical protein F444_21768 [Phytophthora nicotianae P1976]ETP01088.1 hypothetical protein F441_21627 [Phytophthora nicotianae CJ01A1]ETL78321.1 hypothetical protein L917_20871 [Phytophthora nicotianae]
MAGAGIQLAAAAPLQGRKLRCDGAPQAAHSLACVPGPQLGSFTEAQPPGFKSEFRTIVDTLPCFANLDANRGDRPHSSVRKPAAHVLLYADDPRLAWPVRHDAALAALAARSARQGHWPMAALCVGSGNFAYGGLSCP